MQLDVQFKKLKTYKKQNLKFCTILAYTKASRLTTELSKAIWPKQVQLCAYFYNGAWYNKFNKVQSLQLLSYVSSPYIGEVALM